jgi:hypothetical protein
MANTSGTQASIGYGQTMNADAAGYFNALVAKIKAETGYTIVPTEGTRAYFRQLELYNGYVQGRIDPTTGRKYNPAWSPESPFAYHLSGRAVDVGSSVGYTGSAQAKAWRARMLPYGFRETVAGEPWHFEWRKEWATTSIDAASGGDITPIDEEMMSDQQYKDLNDRVTNVEGILTEIREIAKATAASAAAAANSAEQARTRIGADLDGRLGAIAPAAADAVWSAPVGTDKPSAGIKLDQAWSRSGDASKRASTIIAYLESIATAVKAKLPEGLFK